MKYTEAYKFPLHYDGMNYVWDADYEMVIMFDYDDKSTDQFRHDLVKCINGEDIKLSIPTLNYQDGDYYIGNDLLMIQRGWGHLTGVGGLDLDEDLAMTIQDDFADYVLSKLKA